MRINEKVAIVACSNGLAEIQKQKVDELQNTLMGIGKIPILSNFLYAKENVFSGSGEERAKVLMDFYRDDEIKAIYDVSGGDLANEVLTFLDFDTIAKSDKKFWGYSDLTVILNAIFTKTGKSSVLYQVRNLVGPEGEKQKARFEADELYQISYEFLRGEEMQGTLVGGNIRCLLKLAGTEYWPDMDGKILLLEAMGGGPAQMATYLNQLSQIGVYKKVKGILLGTFSQMENNEESPTITDLVMKYIPDDLPVAKTQEIGHGADSKAIMIGEEIILKERRQKRNE